MIFYFIIIVVLFILLFIKNSTLIENLEPNVISLSGSPEDISTILNEGDKQENERISKTFSEGVYLTNNNINYNLLDSTIESLQRQYQYTNNIINNLKINVNATTDKKSTIDPEIKIYGSFPNNIMFDMMLPSAVPGKIGEKGDKGENGEKGKTGKQGSKGLPGPFGSCPQK